MITKSERQHILVLEDSAFRRTIVLDNNQYSMGRHSTSSIQFFSRQASRHHATLIRKFNSKLDEDVFWIIDGDLDGNKSQNGIFINGEKCLVRELKDGDLINFGCNVNASYHNSSGEKPIVVEEVSLDNLKNNIPESEKQAFQARSTLILSQPSITNVRPDDETFQDVSYLDSVTNLPNQTLFLEYVHIALSNAERYQHRVGLVLFQLTNWEDLDNFLGVGLSDLALNHCAQKLRSCLRDGDIVSRWDSTEFMVLLPQVQDPGNLDRISFRLYQSLAAPFALQKHTVEFQVAYGTALYPQNGKTVELLLSTLTKTLHRPENFLSPEAIQLEADLIEGVISLDDIPTTLQTALVSKELQISDAEKERLNKVEKRIEKAIKNDELVLYYQPEFNLETGKIESMEALIRWQHPNQGILAPHQFLPWSDQTSIIVSMTEWILKTACNQHRIWQEQGIVLPAVSVNLSDKQFYHPQLLTMVEKALNQARLAPQHLELEMTESTILRDFNISRQMIKTLHSAGIHVSLDDFGKGYVSVRHLQELSLDKFKIDKIFVNNLLENPTATTMLEALINLGRSFKIQVVSEGVETETQVQILQGLNCTSMQGYYFSKPMSSQDSSRFLLDHNSHPATGSV